MHKKFLLVVAVALLFCGCEAKVADNTTTTPVSNSTADKVSDDHAAIELTSGNFQTDVLDSSKVVLVDFWAPW